MKKKLNSRKSKQFKWTNEMVADIIKCLKAYKSKIQFEGLDFDGDRPCEVRKEMAKLYDEEKVIGVVQITSSKMPLQELSNEEKDLYLQRNREETSRNQAEFCQSCYKKQQWAYCLRIL